MKSLIHHLRRTIYLFLAGLDKLRGIENPAVIVVFHAIDDGSWFFGNSRAQLEAYLKMFIKKYKIIPLSEMVDVIEKKKNYLQPVMSITFDDGYRNIISIAPLLEEYGIKATVFTLSDPHNANRKELETQHELLTEHELVLLNKKFGWEIGSHTATHENLTRLDSPQLQKQIHESKKNLVQRLETEIHYFAYPKGSHNEEVVKHVQKAGYKAAFTMDHHKIALLGDVHRIPRVGINRTYTPREALASLSPSVIKAKQFFSKLISV